MHESGWVSSGFGFGNREAAWIGVGLLDGPS